MLNTHFYNGKIHNFKYVYRNTYVIFRIIRAHLIHIVIEQTNFLEQYSELFDLFSDLCPPVLGYLRITVYAIGKLKGK